MKKRMIALISAAALLFGCAHGEFYTANEDIYYHGKADCIAGSTFGISETAAEQFEKLACPVCVDRVSVGGEMIEIELPEGYVHLQDMDFEDGKLLLCGDIDWPTEGKPWMAMYDLKGNKLQESLGKADMSIVRDAKFLSDGKIAIIRSLGVKEGDCLELYRDGKLVNRFEAMNQLSRIWALEDGFLIYGAPQMYQYHLAKLDNDGKMLWAMDLTELFQQSDKQPGLTDILVGDGVHIAWGTATYEEDSVYPESRPVITAFDDGGNIIARHEVSKIIGEHTKTLYDENMQPVGWETADSYLSGFDYAAWTDSGVMFAGNTTKPGFAMKFGSGGEIWYEHFAYLCDEYSELLVDGRTAESGWIEDMIPWQDGYLLAMGAYVNNDRYAVEKRYVRMAYMNSEGKIIRDWFEEIGDILYSEDLFLMKDGDGVYLMVYGTLMDDEAAYEQGLTQPQIPRKMVLKKIAAE